MNINAIPTPVKAAEVPLNDLAGNKHVTEREKVAEVSRQFEAVLLRQMLQETRKSCVNPASSADATSGGIYDDMINNQLADTMSRSGAFGLAKNLEGELAHQVLPNASPIPPTLTPMTAPPVANITHAIHERFHGKH